MIFVSLIVHIFICVFHRVCVWIWSTPCAGIEATAVDGCGICAAVARVSRLYLPQRRGQEPGYLPYSTNTNTDTDKICK